MLIPPPRFSVISILLHRDSSWAGTYDTSPPVPLELCSSLIGEQCVYAYMRQRAYMRLSFVLRHSDLHGRSPRQYIRQGDVSKRATFLATEDNKFIELELPTAMRIVRMPGTKSGSDV
jgi:hypothetical protein